MNNTRSKKNSVIQKETQEHIKRFFQSNVTLRNRSPASPSIEFDSTFSRILREKRNESTLNQKTLETTNDVNESKTMATEIKDRDICHEQLQTPKSVGSIMDNSLQFVGSHLDGDNDDSFLEMERQCHYEEQKHRMLAIDADNTILSEIEPPPELWENTMMLHAPNVQNLRDDNDDLIHLSPMKMVGLMRPSTIVEETSSQCNSTGENSQCSTENDRKSKNSSNLRSSTSTLQTSSTENSIIEKISPLKLVQDTPSPSPDPLVTQTKRHVDKTRRTMVFKKRDEKRKFFNDENESVTSPLVDIRTPRMQRIGTKNLISLDRSPPIIKVTDTTPSRDQFNDTFEAVEFFMEKGKQLLEQTPLANRTILETPLFSCKRSRILSEMAAVEMQPIPKRGPLLNLYSSPDATPSPKH